jgi:hypothetical protein
MAALTLVYEDDLLRVHWNEEGHYFLSDWLGVFRKGAQLRRAYQSASRWRRRGRPSVWLADTSKIQVLDPSDAKWVADWFWPSSLALACATWPESHRRRRSARCR